MSSQEIVDKLTRVAQGATVNVRVRSALNPALWLSGILTPACFGFAVISEGAVRVTLLISGMLPIVVSCTGYLYFMVKNPDKLQSEDYQLRKQALQLIEERGSRIAISPMSVQAITNPLLTQPKPEEEGE